MEKLQRTIFWTIVASESTHIFCCVLPTIFSILGLMTGVGMVATMPGWMTSIHETIHGWEIPVIIFSAVMLAIGWALYFISRKIDCVEDAGCRHEPCAPKKKSALTILIIATVLFTFNTSIYMGIHRGTTIAEQHEHDMHDHAAH